VLTQTSTTVDDRSCHPDDVPVLNELTLNNGSHQPLKVRLEPYLFADGIGTHQPPELLMPAGATWRVDVPNPQVSLQLVVIPEFVTVLVRGCQVDEVTLTDSASGAIQTPP
jgi:hypothetical protein